MTRRWPPAYYQPDPRRDCNFYAAAYVCHCLGHPEVTGEDTKAWREQEHVKEVHFMEDVLGAEMRGYWQPRDSEGRYAHEPEWWLGPAGREWVERWLSGGWIGLAHVMRVQEMAHAVVLLESRGDDGVLLMDPVHGPVVESWDWFLGAGPGHGNYPIHRIEAWYKGKAA